MLQKQRSNAAQIVIRRNVRRVHSECPIANGRKHFTDANEPQTLQGPVAADKARDEGVGGVRQQFIGWRELHQAS